MIRLPDITLVAVATKDVTETVRALEYSAKGILFSSVLLISDVNPASSIKYSFVQIDKFNSVGDWGKFIVFDLYKYIETKYIILIHADGFIVNPEQWNDAFLNYDYIGAPWPIPKDRFSYRDCYGNIIRVGNSVSLRSKKILELPAKLGLTWESDKGFFHEDGYLTVLNRHILQEHGVKFPPLSVAASFSREKELPENRRLTPFAFHKWAGGNRRYPNFFGKKSIVKRVLSKLILWKP